MRNDGPVRRVRYVAVSCLFLAGIVVGAMHWLIDETSCGKRPSDVSVNSLSSHRKYIQGFIHRFFPCRAHLLSLGVSLSAFLPPGVNSRCSFRTNRSHVFSGCTDVPRYNT